MACVCADCDLPFTIPTPANGHTEVTDAAVEPTCTETGLTAGTHCLTCGKVITAQTEVAATGHVYGDDGICETCGASRTQEGTTTPDDDTTGTLPSEPSTEPTEPSSDENE